MPAGSASILFASPKHLAQHLACTREEVEFNRILKPLRLFVSSFPRSLSLEFSKQILMLPSVPSNLELSLLLH